MAVLGNRSLAYEPFVQDETVSNVGGIELKLVVTIQDWSLALEKRRNTPISIYRQSSQWL